MIFKIIRLALILILCVGTNLNLFAQDAALLPNAKQTFLGQDGKPLSGGKVYFYIPNTSTLKTTWQDADGNVANTNPVILDSSGRAIIYGNGEYRQVVRDRNNNLIWDQLTSSTGSGGSSSTTGDGDLVGTIKPWAGLTAPNQYLFAYGQEVSRTTYSALFTAITLNSAVFCTNSSSTLSGFSDTTQIPIGASVEVTCMTSGTVVVSKTSNSITTNNNASLTTSATALILPWGGGNGTTTFNLPDLRGRVVAGRDNMGGTAASRLTSTYFAEPGIGAVGGLQSKTLITANLPPYTPAGTNSATTFTYNIGSNYASTGGTVAVSAIQSSGGSSTITQSASIFTGTAQGGTSTAFSIVQPTISSNYIIKVIPDQAGNINIGVTSINSMTGAITCSTGLLCSGNLMSIDVATLFAAPSAQVGLSAIPGSASTAMRSDAAPALNQSISPTMSGVWLFSNNVRIGSYLNIGSISVPSNTSAGDLTANRIFLSSTTAKIDIGASGTYATNIPLNIFANTFGIYPASDFSASLGFNFNGGGSLDFWNNYTSSSNSFAFFQKTGTSTAIELIRINPTGLVTIGKSGTLSGQLALAGSTSGTITITGQAAAGTYNFNLPTTSGSAGECLASGGGGASPMTWTTCSGGGGGSPGGSNTQVQFNNSGAFGGSANFTWVSPKLTLGVAGSTAGQLAFGNATSGTITVQAVTGALGTVTLSLPAATDTLVGKATTDIFTNKTYDTAGTGNSFSINGVAVTTNTGTGAVARATSPTFVTPTLGVATSTSEAIGGCTIGSNALCTNGTVTITSTSASALAVGRQGATDPVLKIDASASTVVTGIQIVGAAAAGGVNVAAISSGTNENLTINAKGSGTISLGNTSTGVITLARNTTVSTGGLTLGAAGTASSITMGNATSGTITLQPVTGALGTVTLSLPALTKTLTATIASGAKALSTSAISSATCTTAQTDTATGTVTTDAIIATFNADPTAVTGYVPLTTGMLTIIAYPTADTVNFKVCNNTSSSITPGAVTINWRVVR